MEVTNQFLFGFEFKEEAYPKNCKSDLEPLAEITNRALE